MPLKHGYTMTGVNDPTTQVSTDRWNENHVMEGELVLPNTVPTAPPAGNVAVFSRNIGGRPMLSQMGPSGLDTALQPHLGGNKIALWMPPGNGGTVPGVFGFNTMVATGSPTTRTIATNSMVTRMSRIGYVSATTAGSFSGLREAALKFTVGAGGGLGGFFYRSRFAVTDVVAVEGARMFVGLSNNTLAPTNVEIDTLLNTIGVCQLSTGTNLHFYAAGGAASTAIDLGANFPVRTGSLDAYEIVVFAAANSGSVSYQITRLNTGNVAEGNISSNLPLGTQLMAVQSFRGNNATALAVGIDMCGIYIETDF